MSEQVMKEREGRVVARRGTMRVELPDGEVVDVPCVDRRSKRADDAMQRKLRARQRSSATAGSRAIPDDVSPPRPVDEVGGPLTGLPDFVDEDD